MREICNMELKINPEYEALLPKLTEPEFQELKESIRKDGLHYTLAINKGGVILDGHHRLRACRELGIEPKVEVKVFENVLLEKKFVIESNLKRRHLNKFQRGKLVLPLLEIEKELAKQRQGERTDLTGTSGKYFPDVTKPKRQRKPLTQEQKEARKLKAKLRRDEKKKTGIELKKPNRARTNVARKVQLSDRTLEKVKDILEKGSEELKQKVESGKISISSAANQIKEIERQKIRNAELAEIATKIPNNITLYHGDFFETAIPQDSIQLILTDPPYPEEYLPLWDKLAEYAQKVLVPGGFLIAYCAHFYLPLIIKKLSKYLSYFWVIALTQPQHVLVHSRHVFCDWKPLLIFYKPPLILPSYFGDVINGLGREKEYHEWQQATIELEHIIPKFCPENGIILDPFAGSGTTLIVANKLGRKSIGIEIEGTTFAKLQRRIVEETK